MDKKRLLLVSNGFYPEISPRSFRATELAKELSRQGHTVVVLTKYREFGYSDFLDQHKITIRMWGKPRFPKVPVLRKEPLSSIFRGIARILGLLFEYPGIEEMFQVNRMLKLERGHDLMISFAVPYAVHWGVALARSGKHRISDIWVADCGDPYMGDVLDSFKKPFYFSYLEKAFCRKAEFITIPVESAKPAYYPEFQNKIRVIPQGFDFDLSLKEGPHSKSEIPEFAYAGRFLKGIRDPDFLMKCLIEIDAPFRFYIFTDQPEILNDYMESLNGKLIISPYIPRVELMQKLSKMDFLINFDNNTTLNVPSKLIDYAITYRPVLNINREFNKQTIQAFLDGDYSKRMILPDPEQYHIKNISRQFLDLFSFKSRI